MKKVKFLHCADLHLDMPFTSLGGRADKSSARRQDLKQAFYGIIEAAKSEKADLLLIAGDLYEHEYVKKSTINFINDGFNDIPGTKIVIVPGNHDPYAANSYYGNFGWAGNVYILTRENPCILLEEISTCVYGWGFEDYKGQNGITETPIAVNRSLINILLAHGTLDMNFNKRVYNPLSSAGLEELEMDYIALGHFHSRIMGEGRRRIVYNPGSPEPLGFDEEGDHGFLTGMITKQGESESTLDINFIKAGKRFYANVDVNVDGCCTDEQVNNKVSAAISDRDLKNGLFAVHLKGRTEPGFGIDLRNVEMHFDPDVFFLKAIDETGTCYNTDEILGEPGLRGLFARKIMALVDKAADEQERRLLMKSLHYGLEALERGEVEVGN